MKFLIDAQLPPSLGAWLIDHFSVEAIPLREIGMRQASDREIFEYARAAQCA
jgi:predicted nuclease of predicted toxin-antitoxin system